MWRIFYLQSLSTFLQNRKGKRGFRKLGTFSSSRSVSVLVTCGAATLGREPLLNVPRLCWAWINPGTESSDSISTISIGAAGALVLARLLLEFICNHIFFISSTGFIPFYHYKDNISMMYNVSYTNRNHQWDYLFKIMNGWFFSASLSLST